MKFLAVIFALLATAASHPIVKTWTLSELSEAIQTSKSDSSMRPYLEAALNQIMLAMFTGDEKSVRAVLRSPTGGDTWTVAELMKALAEPDIRPEHRSALMEAYGYVQMNNATGELQDSVKVSIPALDISTWTQSDLYEAIISSDTKAELRPYLEEARIELKKALSAGKQCDTISIVTPVGLVPALSGSVLLPKPTKQFLKKYVKGL